MWSDDPQAFVAGAQRAVLGCFHLPLNQIAVDEVGARNICDAVPARQCTGVGGMVEDIQWIGGRPGDAGGIAKGFCLKFGAGL